MSLVLGVDSSTQSCKVEFREADTGTLVATGHSAHPLATPPASEQAPEAWWRAIVEATRQVFAAGGVRPNDIAASVDRRGVPRSRRA